MKYFILILSTLSFVGCANGKKIQEEPPVALNEAYYTTWAGEEKGANSGFTLFIPAEFDPEVKLDSVYFRGRGSLLEKSGAAPNLYVGYFKNSSGERKPEDVIMHIDPKKEYGNKPPQLPEKIPFELEEGEAVVKYVKGGKEKYFRISGIKKRDSSAVEIKRPENIRH